MIASTFRQSSARLVLPYYSYARQDRRTNASADFSQKSCGRLAQPARLTMDLHKAQIQGSNIPMDPVRGINHQYLARLKAPNHR